MSDHSASDIDTMIKLCKENILFLYNFGDAKGTIQASDLRLVTWQEVNSAQAAITSAKDTREWTDNSTREVRVYAQGSVCGGSADIRDAIADMYENLQIEMSKFMPKIIEQCGAVKDKRLEVVYKDSDDPE